jgi:hypothetical protein
MDRELLFKAKRAKKRLEEILDRKNEFIVDKIFQNQIFVLGTVKLIDKISNENELNAQVAIHENSRIEFNYQNKEFHTLYFIEKNEKLKNFIILQDDFADHTDFDELVGIVINEDKLTDGFGLVAMCLPREGFNRKTVKGILENIFPSPDKIFGSMTREHMINLTKQTMLEELIHLQGKM